MKYKIKVTDAMYCNAERPNPNYYCRTMAKPCIFVTCNEHHFFPLLATHFHFLIFLVKTERIEINVIVLRSKRVAPSPLVFHSINSTRKSHPQALRRAP